MAKLIIAESTAAPELTIQDANLLSLTAPLSSSIDGSEVAVDTCEAIVLADYAVNTGLFIPAGADSLTTSDNKLLYVGVDEQILPLIPYGTRVEYLEDEDTIGVFYLENVTRVSKQTYQLDLMSGLGLLENKVHRGGVYNGTTLADMLAEIIGNTFPYTVDPAIASWPCFGWLPYDTARENLHRVLMAMGVNIFKANGSPYFSLLDDSNPTEISDDAVYINGKVSYGSPATSVAVTEHQWLEAGGDRVILFDNTDGGGAVQGAEVVFDSPAYDLQWTGQTLDDSGANYAVLTGIGVLTGIPYTHIQKIVTKTASPGSVKNREVSVTDDGLINPLNSNNVAQRLMDYYSAAQTVNGKMILGTPRPGSAITVTDAFGDPKTGIVKSMDITSSATVAATFEAVTDYSPDHMGNEFENQATILSSGTWTVPAGVDHIRMILIGGGDGGQGGTSGTDGKGALDMATDTTASQEAMYYAETAEPGQGGDPGAAGQGGSILEGDYDVAPGETITISIGTGGAGGYVGGNFGSPGSPTTASSTSLRSISSADGLPSEYGYKNLLTGITYGQAGIDGEAGGDGGATTTSDESGADGGVGYPGESIASAQGGVGGGGGWAHGGDMSGYFFGHASGGGGGGAAHNSAGYAGRGGQGRTSPPAPDNAVLGGDGGDGADAEAPAPSTPGKGGDGGHGGGGGGNGGGYTITGSGLLGLVTGQAGQAGRGGNGTAGADGGDGVVIILY